MAAEHLSDVLRARADRAPEAVAYEAVDPSGQVTMLTYAQLASRAAALAGQLAGRDGPVLLTCPAGLEYPVAVFAAFLAGQPVIPAYPSSGSTPDRTRLAGMIADARPSTAIAPGSQPGLDVPAVLSVPGAEADGTPWRPSRASAADAAIIQYTSGSTGRPRGVVVRHGSIAANTAAIAGRFGLTAESRGLTWLPPFHDMGLIGGLLTPVMAGFPVRILQPGDFVKAPLWWLKQMTESGATVSGGPNFGYELCLRRARAARDLAGLDLSRWQVAFNGGESVKQRTMVEFAEVFAPAGFRPEAFLPCYGLAEATLIVSAGHWSGRRGPGDEAVSCGTPVPGQRVVVVDQDRLVPAADGIEGEIWIAGPHITTGYLSGEAAGQFGELGAERFLRTGDLGYLSDGALTVTGRAKDVIVYRGVNYHATDIEAAALAAAGWTARAAAAFGVDTGREPLPVLLVEVRGQPPEAAARAIRAAVLTQTGLRLGIVALVPPRSVPRTSSGKIRRSTCRDAFVAGEFDGVVVSDPAAATALADRHAVQAANTELTIMICGVVAGVCEAEDCQPADRLAELGVDSVRAAEAAAVLEDALGLMVPLETVLAAPTAESAADALLGRWLADGCTSGAVRARLALAAGTAEVS
jgi:acyl-CoA synthetase (AMP-forming)/AMP-acid ligase II/acyl carrier protein